MICRWKWNKSGVTLSFYREGNSFSFEIRHWIYSLRSFLLTILLLHSAGMQVTGTENWRTFDGPAWPLYLRTAVFVGQTLNQWAILDFIFFLYDPYAHVLSSSCFVTSDRQLWTAEDLKWNVKKSSLKGVVLVPMSSCKSLSLNWPHHSGSQWWLFTSPLNFHQLLPGSFVCPGNLGWMCQNLFAVFSRSFVWFEFCPLYLPAVLPTAALATLLLHLIR